MRNWINSKFFDGKNNEHVIGLIIGWLAIIGLTAYAVVYNHQNFDPQAFGLGFGLVGTGAGLGKCLAGRDPSDQGQ